MPFLYDCPIYLGWRSDFEAFNIIDERYYRIVAWPYVIMAFSFPRDKVNLAN